MHRPEGAGRRRRRTPRQRPLPSRSPEPATRPGPTFAKCPARSATQSPGPPPTLPADSISVPWPHPCSPHCQPRLPLLLKQKSSISVSSSASPRRRLRSAAPSQEAPPGSTPRQGAESAGLADAERSSSEGPGAFVRWLDPIRAERVWIIRVCRSSLGVVRSYDCAADGGVAG